MSFSFLIARARRALKKSPRQLFQRILQELRQECDRFTQPAFGGRFSAKDVLERTDFGDVDSLWNHLLRDRGWPMAAFPPAADFAEACPDGIAQILARAELAVAHEIDLLGSGQLGLGGDIDWSRDYKTGDRWPLCYFRDIDYVNRGRPSDVKTAWELSRLQWLIPCGQAYSLTGDERFANAARDVLTQWISGNPYACSVNWCVTMEPALRILTWTWLYRALGHSVAWQQPKFREQFLTSLYLHAVFTERYIERSDVNGNHFTADAAALAVAGAFWSRGQDAERWLDSAILDLEREIQLQVHPDGVDFEASSAYHRLVAELFLIGSMAAESAGRQTSARYRERLAAMAWFTSAYMRPDDTAPLWGDHDDARALPLGLQPIRDHRYLVGLIGLHLGDTELLEAARGPLGEAIWWFGVDATSKLGGGCLEPTSKAFWHGGAFVMRNVTDHVFVDCGPVGLGGRGGHGHNDLLSFEAVLDGTTIITEGGCYVYTADFDSRNRDRSTRSHNTPSIDKQEINRFYGPEFLWTLANDATAECVTFEYDVNIARFKGCHNGYHRLAAPVSCEREITLNHSEHSLVIRDRFVSSGAHHVEVPLHLAAGAVVRELRECSLTVSVHEKLFRLSWKPADWSVSMETARESPSYGVCREIRRLSWHCEGSPGHLEVTIEPIRHGVA